MGSFPVDLHLHSVFSDGSLTPGQLAERASAAGLKAVCLTDHDTAEGFSGQNYFPDKMPRKKFYRPPERGFEREILRRLAYWERLRERKNAPRS